MNDMEAKLNDEQRTVYDTVLGAVFRRQAAVRAAGEVVIAVASSGLAALLLPDGRTAHSRFKIPLSLTETSN